MNNKGLSLVELLVAFAVSAVVLAGVSYLILNVMNIFARTNANVELQNESQTAMNLIVDNVMDANGICLIERADGNKPSDFDCVLLGELKVADNFSACFTGEAVIWDVTKKKVYLRTYDGKTAQTSLNISEGEASSESDCAVVALQKVITAFSTMSEEERMAFLMSECVVDFSLKVADYYEMPMPKEITDPNDPENKKKVFYYAYPLVLSLHMEFEREYKSGKPPLTRSMDDDIYLRNGTGAVYIQRVADKDAEPKGMKRYYRGKKNDK